MRKRISFDLDGVLADMSPLVVQVANCIKPGWFPRNHQQEQWNFRELADRKEWNSIWKECMRQPNFWLTMKPYAENIRAVIRYLDAADEVEPFFVTSRSQPAGDSTEIQTRLWLTWVGLGAYAADHIILAKSGQGKAEVMERLKIICSLDDIPKNVIACGAVARHHAFLLDRPWNKPGMFAEHGMPDAYGLVRVASVTDYLEQVEKICYGPIWAPNAKHL